MAQILTLFGVICFLIAKNRTEIGHGSNVQAIETRADYDESAKEFVLRSPTPSSTKFMIGNVGVHGEIVVLMAQLYVKGQRKGVHAFVVPLRASSGGPVLPGVQVGDIGLKSSWNEVDNAWIRFDGMRIPRENLLNRFADVSEDGEYSSIMKSPGKLFAATMAQLLVGRINYVGAPLLGLQTALSTAIIYARSRRQFSPKGPKAPETPIIQYSTHYTYLMDTLAKTVAIQFARNDIIARLPAAKAAMEASNKELSKSAKRSRKAAKEAEISSKDSKNSENQKTQASSASIGPENKVDTKKKVYSNDITMAEYHALLSGLKAYVCEWSYISFGHLRVMCGGAGIMLSNGIGALHNYFDVFQTAEGDRVVLYQQLGKFLLSEASKQYAGFSGMIKYGTNYIQHQLIASNPILALIETKSEEKLSKPGFLLKALQMRQSIAIRFLVGRIQDLMTGSASDGKTRSGDEAWNLSLDYIIRACDAYLERYIFEQCYLQLKKFRVFYADEKERRTKIANGTKNGKDAANASSGNLPTPDLDMVLGCLTTVTAVLGLGFISKDQVGFWGLFSQSGQHAIREAWTTNCKRMNDKYSQLLLDSSEVTDEWIKAPQGQADGDYVSHILKAVKPCKL